MAAETDIVRQDRPNSRSVLRAIVAIAFLALSTYFAYILFNKLYIEEPVYREEMSEALFLIEQMYGASLQREAFLWRVFEGKLNDIEPPPRYAEFHDALKETARICRRAVELSAEIEKEPLSGIFMLSRAGELNDECIYRLDYIDLKELTTDL